MEKRGPGRPYTENPRTEVVPHRMTREEQRMLHLKAALYTGGNTSKLLRQAVSCYKEEKTISCSEVGCSGHMNLVPIEDYFQVIVAGASHEVVLHDMPVYQCNVCGNQEHDMKFAAVVETVVDEEVGFLLNQRKEIPKELYFQDLITA